MAYTLERFVSDCRKALEKDAGPEGRTIVCNFVSKACLDNQFKLEFLSDDNAPERRILYEDRNLGFCICTHFYQGARASKPHGHGGAWAIYGQAVGQTLMNDWKCIREPIGEQPGLVEKTQEYVMNPGDVRLYNEEDLHSPSRKHTTRLIRIEGRNLDFVKRVPYRIAS